MSCIREKILWPDFIPPLMEYCLRFLSVWPDNSNAFGYPLFALLCIFSLTFQFWDAIIVAHNLELLIDNLTNFIMIATAFAKVTFFWKKRWYVKGILSEMIYDWRNVKSEDERNFMISQVKFSHNFFIFSNTAYNFSACMFLTVALWSYATESVENRQFPIQATFPFPSKVFPFYELLCFVQFLILILISVGFALIDSFYVTTILHAGTKIDMVRIELDRFITGKIKMEDKLLASSGANILIGKHHKVIEFSQKIEEVYSTQLIAQFFASTLGICVEGFTILTLLESNSGVFKIFKYSLLLFAATWQIGTYCVVGDFLRSKSISIAEAVYLQPWHMLRKSTDCKTLMMLIQRAQKPLSIRAGYIIILSNFSLTNLLKASASYLSVLRAIRN